jgi:TRAP-type mannitol/chloroaromatic compound transport system permease small subunit
MGFLLSISRMIDGTTRFIGYHVRWLILAAVIVSAVNAIIRKVFDSSSNAWLELQWLLFGAVFMLASAYVLQVNAHVRIDVLSNHFSKRTRDIIDAICHVVMLAPLATVMVWLSFPFFWESFKSGEVSNNAGGLPVWPAKFLIFAGFVLLLLQMVSELVKRLAVLSGRMADPEPAAAQGHVPKTAAPAGGRDE